MANPKTTGEPLAPTCSMCREPRGTCFPDPCKRHLASKSAANPRPPETMTRAEFSKRAGYIAQLAAKWATDSLELPERVTDPVLPGTIERFCAEITRRLEAINGR